MKVIVAMGECNRQALAIGGCWPLLVPATLHSLAAGLLSASNTGHAPPTPPEKYGLQNTRNTCQQIREIHITESEKWYRPLSTLWLPPLIGQLAHAPPSLPAGPAEQEDLYQY